MGFSLHLQLAKDCTHVCDLGLCRVLLMENATFPWLILVPMRDGARELFDLSEGDYALATAEIRNCAEKFASLTNAYKMNVAALGNMVPQLHIHIIARYENDAAWPAPVWNNHAPVTPYTGEARSRFIEQIRALFS